MRKFLDQKTMNSIRHEERVLNSIVKRKKIDGYAVLHVWGCGCCFGYIKERDKTARSSSG